MAFNRPEMLYDDGYYKWSARADHDNPNYRQGTDYDELNKTEGYEVLNFLNSIGAKRWNEFFGIMRLGKVHIERQRILLLTIGTNISNKYPFRNINKSG